MIRDLAPLPHAGEYRKDGWPLCPRCGSDELASTVPLFVHEGPEGRRTRRPKFAKPTDPMRCLYCRWEGTVPAKATP